MDQELVQYLEERFNRQERGFHALLNERFERQEQRFNARFDATDQRIEEVKRHTGVLVEGLRHEIQLVAEGLTMHIQVQHVQEREYHDQQHRETRALIRSFYDELRQQDEQLRQRVENLERKPPN
jgi:hypothetical protein